MPVQLGADVLGSLGTGVPGSDVVGADVGGTEVDAALDVLGVNVVVVETVSEVGWAALSSPPHDTTATRRREPARRRSMPRVSGTSVLTSRAEGHRCAAVATK